MDDIINRIGELLSDEESLKQLSELAQILVSDDSSDKSGEDKAEIVSPDIESVLKLTSLIGQVSKQDKNTELLIALKPHLSDEKQKRVDKALKLLKILAVWNIAKDSGILNELI